MHQRAGFLLWGNRRGDLQRYLPTGGREKSNICDISLKDVLAKLTVEEAEGSSLDTKVDSVSEAGPEAEPEAGPEAGPEVGAQVDGTVVDSGAYKNFATTTTTVFFILSMYFS